MSASGSKRPNVIVFFTDQQRWDASGLHGNPLDLMPNFDRLARQGTHVANSFTCQPVCGPARACLQTGTYATTNGCYRNGMSLPAEMPNLATSFREAGYKTGYIGKWHLADDLPISNDDGGHACWRGAANEEPHGGPVAQAQRGGYEYWLASNVLEMTSDSYDTWLFDEDHKAVHLPGYRVDAQTDAMIRYVDQHKDEPFFLFSSFLEPHHQNHVDDYPAPDGYRERYTGRWTPPDLAALPSSNENWPNYTGGSTQHHLGGYWGMIKRLDEALGRLIDSLKSLNLLDNTIILFTSDHACHFKTRNKEYKRSCHESSIRVPTMLHGPGLMGGGELSQMVSLVDLPATLLDAAGIEIPSTMQGRSILPLLKGQTEDWPQEAFVQISEDSLGRAVRTKRWKYCVTAPPEVSPYQPSSEVYVESHLYDLQHDPYELRNLIETQAHQPVRDVMRQRLLRRMIEIGESEPRIELAEITFTGQASVTEAEAWQ